MQVRHGFAGVGTIVDDQAKPAVQAEFPRHAARDEQEMPEQRLIVDGRLREPGDDLFRDDE